MVLMALVSVPRWLHRWLWFAALYAAGQGVQRHDLEAVKLYRQAADQGVARAQYGIALMYAYGRGLAQNEEEAARWSHLAAEYDQIQAMTSARGVIEQYCNEEQKKKGEAAISEWKRRWSKEAKAPAPDR